MTSTMPSGSLRELGDMGDRELGDARPSVVDTVTPVGGDARLGRPVEEAIDLLERALDLVDVDRITGADAVTLYRLWVTVDRKSLSAKTTLAPCIDGSKVWRDSGHANAAALLAELEGIGTGAARTTLDVGRRLQHLPATEEALRKGELSGPKADELSGAAILDPGTEAGLLAGVAEEPLARTRERCHRARATATQADPLAAIRRIRANRYFRWWTDAEGAFCYEGRDTADRGAKIRQQIEYSSGRLTRSETVEPVEDGPSTVGPSTVGPVEDGPSEDEPVEVEPSTVGPVEDGPRTTEPNRRADAAFLLLTADSSLPPPRRGGRSTDSGTGSGTNTDTGSGSNLDTDEGPPEGQIAAQPGQEGPAGEVPSAGCSPPPDDVIDRPPTCSITVLVDLDALLRGSALPGDTCEITNQGPIPVAMARDLASDSFLRLAFHRAGDIRAISHAGRTINKHLRTALAHRDHSRCVVPGCTVTYGLEIDHIVAFARGGPTTLDNLALLCHHHHWLKTYEGWTLAPTGRGPDGSPTWAFTPLPPFDHDPDPPPPRR